MYKLVLVLFINFLLIELFASKYYILYFLFLSIFYLYLSTLSFSKYFAFIYIFIMLLIMQLYKFFDDDIFDLKIYIGLDFNFVYIDELVVYILIFLQLLIFIVISKNLGYNVKKV